MTDDIIKRLREAIAARPTPGPWKIRAERYKFIHVYATGGGICHLDTVDGEGAANAKLIAAASPDNIAALLDRLDAAEREHKSIRDILLRNGFVECDIPACNCGSWHHRYGLPERFHEIKDALADAGHELSNANGNTTLGALNELIEQRDAAEAENERLRAVVSALAFQASRDPFVSVGHWCEHGPCAAIIRDISNPNADHHGPDWTERDSEYLK